MLNSLRENAIASIKLGVEQYRESIKGSGPNPVLGLSAIRNLHSGILLLIKAELCELCPPNSNEVLIKKEFSPIIGKDGKVMFVGIGDKTIDVETAIRYCKSLGISLDATALRSITKERNALEHYYSKVNEQGLRQILASACKLLHGFIRANDFTEPADVLGDAWGLLLTQRELYEAEQRRCKEKLRKIKWHLDVIADSACDASCSTCGASLIEPVGTQDWKESDGFRCVACNEHYETENFIELALADMYSASQYHSIAEGGAESIATCPFCTRDCYLVDENLCAACRETCAQECKRCLGNIPPEELSEEPYCSWCIHQMSKD